MCNNFYIGPIMPCGACGNDVCIQAGGVSDCDVSIMTASGWEVFCRRCHDNPRFTSIREEYRRERLERFLAKERAYVPTKERL